MNVTIKLSKAQASGIRKYLKDTSNEVYPKVTPTDIKQFVAGEALSALEYQRSAVSDYIRAAEQAENRRIAKKASKLETTT